MNKKAKNYLILLIACFFLFLLTVNLLQIYELLEVQRTVSENAAIPSQALIWAFFEGLVSLFFFSLYFLSRGSEDSFKKTFADRKKLITSVSVSLIGAVSAVALVFFVPAALQNLKASVVFPENEITVAESSKPEETVTPEDKNEEKTEQESQESSRKTGQYKALEVVSEDSSLAGLELLQDEYDSSVIVVENGATLNLSDSQLQKAGEKKGSAFGINSALLLLENTTLNMSGTTILLNSEDTPAFSALKAQAQLRGSTLNSIQSKSPLCNFEESTVTMQGTNMNSSADRSALITQKNSSTRVEDATLTTQGSGSPFFDGSGRLEGVSLLINMYQSLLANIEAGSEVYLKDSLFVFPGQSYPAFFTFGEGEDITTLELNRNVLGIYDNYNYYNYYPATSIQIEKGLFTMDHSRVILNLSGNVFAVVPQNFLWMVGSESVVNVVSQSISGSARLDAESDLTLNLTAASSYNGTINPDHNGGKVSLNISADSALVLSGDSYVDALYDEDGTYSNIVTNGYTLYVNNQPFFG